MSQNVNIKIQTCNLQTKVLHSNLQTTLFHIIIISYYHYQQHFFYSLRLYRSRDGIRDPLLRCDALSRDGPFCIFPEFHSHNLLHIMKYVAHPMIPPYDLDRLYVLYIQPTTFFLIINYTIHAFQLPLFQSLFPKLNLVIIIFTILRTSHHLIM